MLALYRMPEGGKWGGQNLEDATGGTVTRSYVSNLKNGRIENPGLAKLEAIAEAMGFPPALWFGDANEEGDRIPDEALLAASENAEVRKILEVAMRVGARERRRLLVITRQITSPLGPPS